MYSPPPPVLHEVDTLRTFRDQRTPPGKRDESTNLPDEICSWAGASARQRNRAGLGCEVAGSHPNGHRPIAVQALGSNMAMDTRCFAGSL